MIRLRIPGGVCTPAQWLQLDRHRPRLRQRHAAAHDAPDLPVPRRHQVEPEDHHEGDRRGAARHARRLRRRQPQRARGHEPAPVAARTAPRSSSRTAISDHLLPHTPRLSRDLARRREDRGRRGGGGRADLRPHLSAAQVQDRRRGAALERGRRLRPGSRLHRDPRRGRRGRGLERHRRRRHGHDARRAGHLSAHRRRDGASARPRTRSRSPRPS